MTYSTSPRITLVSESTRSNWKSKISSLSVKNSAKVPSRFSHNSVTPCTVFPIGSSISAPSEPSKSPHAASFNDAHNAELASNAARLTLK